MTKVRTRMTNSQMIGRDENRVGILSLKQISLTVPAKGQRVTTPMGMETLPFSEVKKLLSKPLRRRGESMANTGHDKSA